MVASRMAITFGILGLVIGSFLNVIIARYNTGLGINGRSKCFSCSKTLSAIELVPVFSFLYLKGKCRSCGSKISLQYISVEIITGLLFYLVVSTFSLNLLSVIYLVIISLLIIILVYDLRHKIIPDLAAYLFIVLSIIANFSKFGFDFSSLNFLIGPLFFAGFALVWLVTRGKWMGFGDAKLVLGIGFLLGFSKAVFAILLSFWTGALVGIFLLAILRGSITIKYEIPFAPFLVFGTLVALFVPFNLLRYLANTL